MTDIKTVAAHTPGPWNNLPRHECIPICRQDEAGLSIGFVHSSDPERQAQGLANAFLMCAAPDLLEALDNMLAAFDNPILRRKLESSFNSEAIDCARTAVAKARGEA